jgi:hypothetical protein
LWVSVFLSFKPKLKVKNGRQTTLAFLIRLQERDFFSILTLCGLAFFQIGSMSFCFALAIAVFASFLYVWYQAWLRVQGMAYPSGEGLTFAIAIPLATILISTVVAFKNFCLLAAAHR